MTVLFRGRRSDKFTTLENVTFGSVYVSVAWRAAEGGGEEGMGCDRN